MEQEQKSPNPKHLYRSRKSRVIFGVCGGLGEYFEIDPFIIRIIFIALTLAGGSGILLYLILAFLIPLSPNGAYSAENPERIDIKERADELVSELRAQGFRWTASNWIGAAIIILGVMLFLNQIFPSYFFNGGLFWALVIIIAGIAILTRKKNNQPSVQSPEPPTEQAKEINRYYPRIGFFRLTIGIILLFFGIGLLAQNFGIAVNFDFWQIFQFWPVLIILAGLSLLSRGSAFGRLISGLIILVVLILILISFFWQFDSREIKQYDFQVGKDSAVTLSNVHIKTGAANLNVSGGSNDLVSGNLKSNITSLETENEVRNGKSDTIIETANGARFFGGRLTNDLNINLSNETPLALTVDSGASKMDIDLSTIAAEDVSINTGASSLDLIVGSKAASANYSISAGASTIRITLPKEIGAKVSSASALTSKNFTDFRQINQSSYESDNFSSTDHKVYFNIEAGVSSIDINWR
ncbi:PspC domain-containing protein [Patescibacteria group bacterium]|nr:MAG: PspC domain-containing protein [Patescibacteria group bacterium]